MPRTHSRQILMGTMLCTALAAFVYGVAQLMRLSFDSAEVFPDYSSLRNDPVGVKGLCESIGALPGMTVSRNFAPLSRLTSGRDTTLFFLGVHLFGPGQDIKDVEEAPLSWVQDMEAVAVSGGRVVLGFLPVGKGPDAKKRDKDKAKADAKEESPREGEDKIRKEEEKKLKEERDALYGARPISIKERWGVGFGFIDLPTRQRGEDDLYRPVSVNRSLDADLPESIPWHTALVFEDLSAAWRGIYTRDGKPVLIERPWGKGFLVLVGDPYLLSNEALRGDRRADLLAWIIGPNSHVVFDEGHLGLDSRPSMMSLARRYRLHGLFAAIALFAALFVWRNVSSLVPREEEAAISDPVAGKDAASGFVNLLRRNVPARSLLGVCAHEWKTSVARERKELAHVAKEIDARVEGEEAKPITRRDPVGAYRDLCRIVADDREAKNNMLQFKRRWDR